MDVESEPRLHNSVEEFRHEVSALDWCEITDVSCQNGKVLISLRLDTSEFTGGPDGLPVKSRERINITVGPEFPWVPPTASVKHWDWAGFPHVLLGRQLCLYLDPSTQWDPNNPVNNYLCRLAEWFTDAIAGDFDPGTALFHPVGGVPHRTPGAPTIVVTEPLPLDQEGFRFQRIQVRDRTPHCIEVVSWRRKPALEDTRIALLVILPEMLPIGAGTRLSDLACIVTLQQSSGARKRLTKRLRELADDLGNDDPLQLVIAVPNPANQGQRGYHLIAAHIGNEHVSQSLSAATSRRPTQPPSRREPELLWLYVDDSREALSVRRDRSQPIQQYRGLKVELWGCGALGSWIAEFLARAGTSQITIRDYGHVTQGLLVRQNYTHADVGRHKVDAVADRIRAINSSINVRPVRHICQLAANEELDCDIIIDVTVSTSVATAIEDAQGNGNIQVPVVQLAADSESASLGIVTVCHPSSDSTTNDIDVALQERVENDPALAAFRGLWNPDEPAPITPALGCSVPTFRGSGADLAAIASEGLNLAARLLSRRVSGGYLFSTPSSPHSVPTRTAVALAPDP
ncbi:ThiF family adenylyltransferase [Candidatus Poriferisodalis sp.]|uniref:ThiF family adenylyltransferase n=1 Tax=Candidatus Poriferisodalis sp. TaxID=3101277 RepID=UPI003AF8687C